MSVASGSIGLVMRLGYLYSRYPVLSQTFCDTEMLELERRGFELLLGVDVSTADADSPRVLGPPAGARALRTGEVGP